MVLAVQYIVFLPSDQNQVWVLSIAVGELDVHLKFLHNFADGASPSTNQPWMDAMVKIDLLRDHAVQVIYYLQDVLFSCMGIGLVASNGDQILVLRILLWELDVDIMGIADLGDDSSTATNDLGVVGWVHVHFQPEVAQLLQKSPERD